MSLDLIPKARSKDDGTQAYLYAKQCGIRNKLHTTSKPLQHPASRLKWPGSNSNIAILNPALILCEIGLDLLPKDTSKDEGTQTYLYVQQPGNLSNVGLETNYKQLQNQLQHLEHDAESPLYS
ncbi:hypothetical protein MtrunA17_Chr4g0025581 [Medicago truncatula]|uniref:Uncharacterized protein n=1 Tax=Medicago truncatula TaxID=3880 RepID=A0A072UJB1_MEDTR|nr:hypothetical protein MTR_4g051568 [Medicago truncatula]RHN60414.1 hypothetical protein MtrunA17_Chr4g0025581 [Medicago truncatula]